jgi:choice-of-anchor B domain-containing protein
MSKSLRGALLVLAVLGSAPPAHAQGTPNVVLLAHLDKYPAASYSDCWGYTAPDGREYALVGVQTGTSIVDITDPAKPVEVTFIPGPNSSWRDLKTFQHYAYVVNESGGGMHIIDLSLLPESASLVATYTGFTTSHNIWIDETTATLYAEGSGSQPVRVLSLADPTSPVQIGSFGVECHDVFVQDDIAYISEGNQGSVGLYDVSNPAAATRLRTVTLPAPSGYAHNAWASADGRFLMTTEETTGETVKMFDLSGPSPVLTDQYLGPSNLAHNVHMRGNFAYIAHYADGLRIVDISDPGAIFEAGSYDTNPAGGGFNGAWGAYPYFPSGKVIISDIQNGLWVFFFDDGTLPPTITSTPGGVARVGQRYAYDADGKLDVLGTPPFTFSSTGPAGFAVNPATGTVRWIPTAQQEGTHAISITATNAWGSFVQEFTVRVRQAPQ